MLFGNYICTLSNYLIGPFLNNTQFKNCEVSRQRRPIQNSKDVEYDEDKKANKCFSLSIHGGWRDVICLLKIETVNLR